MLHEELEPKAVGWEVANLKTIERRLGGEMMYCWYRILTLEQGGLLIPRTGSIRLTGRSNGREIQT